MRKQHMRAAALVLAIVFQTVVWSDAAGLHGCPIHDAVPTGMAPGAAMHAGAENGPATHPMPGGDAHHGSHDVCTCVGSCQIGDVALPAAAVVATPLEVPTVFVATFVAQDIELPGTPSFLLPYSQGPPHLA